MVTKKLANLFKSDLPQDVDRSLYTKDLLHLNVKGTFAMKEYLEGALTTMIRDKKKYE
jgi:lysophospholipase L1-like esterase